ncbi:hypothetical protein [Actinomadura hibisca]|uniref:hypothetical protein n=1 Tax=Actinomadura hibisca TaxID=68565 RepID=UPI0008351432|nr:hypothetical protein [Actinomadura hibisca]
MLGVLVDLPWSYAAGAGIALAAAHQLRGAGRAALTEWSERPERPPRPGADTPLGRAPKAEGATAGRHFVLAMLYSALVFVPASLFVAHRYPEWATAQHSATISGNDLLKLAGAELALTALGFLLTRALLVAGRIRWAVLQVLLPCLAMALILVHDWRRFLSTDRADHATFPDHVRLRAPGPLLTQAADFLTSGLAVALYVTGAVTVGALALVMGLLHQFGLTDAGVHGPGLPGAAFVGAVTVAGIVAVALVLNLLFAWTGWIGPLVAAPLLWIAVVMRGSYATVVVDDLALPAERAADDSEAGAGKIAP